jgi:ubiquinone/menaquinone biosynthesis C-methylase UbiE
MIYHEDKTVEVARDWKVSSYYDTAEKEEWLKPFWNPEGQFRRLFDQLNMRKLVDLACGHGRHTARILDIPEYRNKIECIYAMDINEENIKFCVERFCSIALVHPLTTNGYDFQPLNDESVTAIFCYDAMVHFEYDAVISYLRDAFRVLIPGGLALFHHSNYDKSPGAHYTKNPGSRNFMSKNLFAHIASRAGFKILEQSVINWDRGRKLDCISLIEKRAKLGESIDREDDHPITERFYDQAISTMLQLMEVEPGARVLDAGCGSGVRSLRVARAGNRVCAIDISQTMLQRAETRISAAGYFGSVMGSVHRDSHQRLH